MVDVKLLNAIIALLNSCDNIDTYTYHDAPSDPIHDEWAEKDLREVLTDMYPEMAKNLERRGW